MNPSKLNALLRRPVKPPAALPELLASRDPIAVLVHSFLLWEASAADAVEAFRRIQESMVDFNDVRVSLPRELMEVIGPRYPRCEERARRLRASLNEIFRREHALRLPAVGGKRDVKVYVETCEGMVVPFVAARVLLICFGVHGIPVDEQTRAVLADHGLCSAEADLAEVAGALARHVKAEHAEQAHAALQALADTRQAELSKVAARPAARPAAKPAAKRPAAKPTTARRSGTSRS